MPFGSRRIALVLDTALKLPRSGHLRAVLNRSLLLRSIPKSGTNYLRLLITNYTCNLAPGPEKRAGAFTRISYREMHHRIFPNMRSDIYERKSAYREPEIHRAPALAEHYADFLYDHGCILDRFRAYLPKKLLLSYRNPLDTIISMFFYTWKNRQGREDLYDHPREVIDPLLANFVPAYRLIRSIHRREGEERSLLIAYERIFLHPHEALGEVLAFLGLEVDRELVSRSVEAASIKETRKEEAHLGGAIHAPKEGLKGSFARSGKVGQWREFFDEADLDRIRTRLRKGGIDLEEFCLDPKTTS